MRGRHREAAGPEVPFVDQLVHAAGVARFDDRRVGRRGVDPDGAGGRIGVLHGPDGVLVVDSQYGQVADKVMAISLPSGPLSGPRTALRGERGFGLPPRGKRTSRPIRSLSPAQRLPPPSSATAGAAFGDASFPVDAAASKLTVRVFKSGLFSTFAHDHEIEARLTAGTVDTSALSVDLRIASAALRVVDPKASAGERAKVQQAMEGPKVLDVARYPEIRFYSTAIEASGADRWTVLGTLEMHGESRPIRFDVRRENGLYRGTATLRQTEFGIKPVRLAAGTVRVKDEVRVEFEVKAATEEEADAVPSVHDHVLDGERPAQLPAVPEAEQRLPVAAGGQERRVESVAGRLGHGAAQTRRTIFPKCSDPSIASCARRACSRGSTAWTTVRTLRAKNSAAASSSSALLPM